MGESLGRLFMRDIRLTARFHAVLMGKNLGLMEDGDRPMGKAKQKNLASEPCLPEDSHLNPRWKRRQTEHELTLILMTFDL